MEHLRLQTQNMAVGYNKKILISGINLEIGRSEIVTLIGPNGAGKSTILKSVIRELELLGGAAVLDGKEMAELGGREIARKMAILMTRRPSPELMTCREVVATGRYPYTGRLGLLHAEDEKKIDDALEMVHGEELADCLFQEMSDGQMQRILLARCICQEPEIIVLDEPTSFLDLRYKSELLHILKRLSRERGIAVLQSLHELDLAQKISDRLVCIRGSRVDRIGTPEEIFRGGYIPELYELQNGSYLPLTGSLELEPVSGKTEIFVIGGGGSGIPCYRSLQRQGIPFSCGILWEHDKESDIARALASKVILSPGFEPVTEEIYESARHEMLRCPKVICTVQEFGSLNRCNRKLMEEARSIGLLQAESQLC